MSEFQFPTRVAYPDIQWDKSLSMTGALRLMQEAAAVHAHHLGCGFYQSEQIGFIWMLAGWRAQLEAPAMWNDNVTVTTWPRSVERVTSHRCFEIHNEKGQLVAKADATWILVNVHTHRAMRVTPEVTELLPLTERDVFDGPMELCCVTEPEVTWRGQVLARDLDTNNHVNNLVYLEYARQALPEELRSCRVRQLKITYRRQLLLGDQICCQYRKGQGSHHMIEIRSEDQSVLHSEVVMVLDQ